MSAWRQEVIGDARLILGDCREILPKYGGTSLAVVTDPPYGLGKRMQGGTWGAQDHNSGFLRWDLETPDDVIETLLALEVPTIIWGGNYFKVPPSRCWLIWHKVNAVPTMADFEMAWTNLDRPAKQKSLSVGRVEFGHPTQKPLTLMEWCLGFIPNSQTIIDPFMGSGTTGVACANLGRSFIGIEREPAYFDIACRRIAKAYEQPRLFDEPAPKPVQPSLLGDVA